MSSIYPIIGYRDAPAAVEWLCRAFGFREYLRVDGPDDTLVHAELAVGPDAMVMVGSIQNDIFGLRVPAEIDANTSGIYVAIDNVADRYVVARDAGAEVLQEPVHDGFGNRFTVRDLEGHLWIFGDYSFLSTRQSAETLPPQRRTKLR
jgi:uncharacterized glyoxalase superfamily protein PhnB